MPLDVEQRERMSPICAEQEAKELNEENEITVTKIHGLGFLIQLSMNFIK